MGRGRASRFMVSITPQLWILDCILFNGHNNHSLLCVLYRDARWIYIMKQRVDRAKSRLRSCWFVFLQLLDSSFIKHLRISHPFLREQRLAKKYWDRLFKEYCICDLSRYKENKVAMRWRTEKEVLDGKGQFTCGEKRCEARDDLKSWEVNFAYIEEGQKKNALVKLRNVACLPWALVFLIFNQSDHMFVQILQGSVQNVPTNWTIIIKDARPKGKNLKESLKENLPAVPKMFLINGLQTIRVDQNLKCP